MRAVRTAAVTAGLVAVLVTVLTAATGAAQAKTCNDFADEPEAQAFYDATTNPDDWPRLDADGDGKACEFREGPALAKNFRVGIYEVGRDIAAGRYRTPGGTADCYWGRLLDDTGAPTAIIANSLGTGPRSMTVLPTDAFVDFRGPCLWTLNGATAAEPTTTTPTTSAGATSTTATSTTATTSPTLPAATTTPVTTAPQVSVIPNGGVATGGRSGS